MSKNSSQRRIAVAGGFTAGHILPAIELLRAYRAAHGAQGFFIGCPAGLEDRLVLESGERLEKIPGAPFAARDGKAKTDSIVSLARGIFAGRALLRREATQLVIGFGSYASIGACLAAWSLGIPVVLHESNARFGKANRILRPFARRVCVAFDGLSGDPDVLRTGTPCRPGIEWVPPAEGPLRVLVIGGSQGSPHLNQQAPKLLAAMGQNRALRVIHLCGNAEPAAIASEYSRLGVRAQVEEFSYAMPELYAQSDFVIACAGGACLAEIANQGLAALLVPLSGAAENHQTDNAQEFSRKTGCLWVAEREWDAQTQARRVMDLLENPDALHEIQTRSAAWAVRDSAQRIIAVCEDVLSKGVLKN